LVYNGELGKLDNELLQLPNVKLVASVCSSQYRKAQLGIGRLGCGVVL